MANYAEELDVKNLAILLTTLLVLGFLAACAGTPGGSNWKENKRRRAKANMGMPTKLKPDKEDVPLAVRQIETQIDRSTVILASEATIFVSKNYEFDISLTGDEVTRDLDKGGAKESLALGNATAFVRNLKVECDRSIRVKIADFGTKPFIKISAQGHCSHIILGNNNASHEVKRAQAIHINNDNLRYFRQKEEMAVGLTDQ